LTDVPRIGVVGCGWWGTSRHMPGLASYKGAQLAALADPSPEKLRAASERFGVKHVFADPDALFRSGTVDGVIIAVPHVFHHALARAALEAGLHVLVEKPMALRATDAWELVRLADERRLHLLVGYTLQYSTLARRIRDVLLGGAIGELLVVSALQSSDVESLYRGHVETARGGSYLFGPEADTYSDPGMGGGQGQTQATHAMGLVLWTTDRRVEEVTAYMHSHDLAVDLADAVTYRFDNGAIGTLASTGSLRLGQGGRSEYRYFGAGGHIIHDLHAKTAWLFRNDAAGEQMGPFADDHEEQGFRTGRTLADLIAGHGINRSPGAPAARTVEFLEAAYRSAEIGEPVAVAKLADP
jgi:predicted dehydrogenase